jgi:DNA topoisomerase IA
MSDCIGIFKDIEIKIMIKATIAQILKIFQDAILAKESEGKISKPEMALLLIDVLQASFPLSAMIRAINASDENTLNAIKNELAEMESFCEEIG